MSKIIHVPAQTTITQLPVVETDYKNTNMTCVLPSSITRDQMEDYYAWNCKYGTEFLMKNFEISINDYIVQQRIWELSEIGTWAETNCEYPILVQRVSAYNKWRLVFAGGESDMKKFSDWFYSRRLGHVCHFSEKQSEKIKEWVNENIFGYKKIYHGHNRGYVTITFRDENDAAIFKLRWADELINANEV